jgi:hypothetical protein
MFQVALVIPLYLPVMLIVQLQLLTLLAINATHLLEVAIMFPVVPPIHLHLPAMLIALPHPATVAV